MFKKLSSLTPTQYGPLLILAASVLWALDGILRRSLYSLPPITIVFYEHLIGLLLVSPIALPKLVKESLTKKDLLLMSVISIFSGVLGTLWFTTALVKVNFIAFSIVFLIAYLEPIFATISAAVILKEKITTSFLKWAALALVAAFFATFKNGVVNLSTGNGTLVAALYALGATASWGTSTTLSKLFLKEKSDVGAVGLRFLLTSIFAFVTVLLMGQFSSLSQPNASQFARFGIIALSSGMLSLFLYYKGLKYTEAKITTILELVFPVLAIFIDAVVFKSFLSPQQYLAALVLVFAISQISRLNKQKVV